MEACKLWRGEGAIDNRHQAKTARRPCHVTGGPVSGHPWIRDNS